MRARLLARSARAGASRGRRPRTVYERWARGSFSGGGPLPDEAPSRARRGSGRSPVAVRSRRGTCFRCRGAPPIELASIAGRTHADTRGEVMPEQGRRGEAALRRDLLDRQVRRLQEISRPADAETGEPVE